MTFGKAEMNRVAWLLDDSHGAKISEEEEEEDSHRKQKTFYFYAAVPNDIINLWDFHVL
jgi:hypothetical protein